MDGQRHAAGRPFPADGTGAQTTFFDLFSILGAFADPLEPNESRDFAVAALLGADNTYVQPALTLHSATDVDVFRVIALHTGKLDVEIEFSELIADIQVVAQDRYGNTIATGAQTTLQPGSSVETLTIPVVQGQSYFVRVADPGAPNRFAPQSRYGLTVVNRAAPVPFALDLTAASDTGRNDADDVTNDAAAASCCGSTRPPSPGCRSRRLWTRRCSTTPRGSRSACSPMACSRGPRDGDHSRHVRVHVPRRHPRRRPQLPDGAGLHRRPV